MVPSEISRSVLKRLSALLFFAILGATELRAELNLSPRKEDFDLDGVKLWRLAFENGTSQKATYQPPAGWLYSGGSNELALQPPGKTQVKVVITKIEPEHAISFRDVDREKLKQRATEALPEGSLEIKIGEPQLNVLQISGKDTCLVEVSYSAFGEKFRRYFLLLDLGDGQLRFQLTCRERDYAELMQAFQKSLYTWQHLI
jgi:hypothetical protein